MIVRDVKLKLGDLYDKTIYTDPVTATSTTESALSNQYNTLKRNIENVKPTYLEDNYWLLDGSFTQQGVSSILPTRYFSNAGVTYFPEDKYTLSATTNVEDNFKSISTKFYIYNTDFPNYQLARFECETSEDTTPVAKIDFDIKLKEKKKFKKNHKYFARVFRYLAHDTQDIDMVSVRISNATNTVGRQLQFKGTKLAYPAVVGGKPCEEYNTIFTWGDESISKEIGEEEANVLFRVSWSKNRDGSSTYGFFSMFDPIIIDLTETFGYGYEPDIEGCENVLFPINTGLSTYGYIHTEKSIYESERVSDSNGTNNNQTLTYVFDSLHDTLGYALKFPKYSIEKSFKIRFYRNSILLHSKTIDNNDKEEVFIEATVLEFNKIEIDLLTSQPYQRHRLKEINFSGKSIELTSDDVIEIYGSRKIPLLSSQTENGELNFTFFNDNVFEVQTIKELANNTLKNAQIVVEVKPTNNFQVFCKYYIDNVEVTEDGKSITMQANDILYLLGSIEYQGLEFGKYTADAVIKNIINASGLDIKIINENALKTVNVCGLIEKTDCREALRLLCEATNLHIEIDKEGNIGFYVNMSDVTGQAEITKDKIVEETLEITNDNSQYVGVKVIEHVYSSSGTETSTKEYEYGSKTGQVKTIDKNMLIASIGDFETGYGADYVARNQYEDIQKYTYRFEFVNNSNLSYFGYVMPIYDNTKCGIVEESFEMTEKDYIYKLGAIER